MKLEYPGQLNSRYRNRHPKYILNTAKAAGLDIRLTADTTIDATECRFTATLDGKVFVLDFDNFNTLTEQELSYPHIFKLHTEAGMPANVHPFPVVSWYDWTQYEQLAGESVYTAESDAVGARQKARDGAQERRTNARRLLHQGWHKVRCTQLPQVDFWREVSDVLVAVFVPGARNEMLDRGHTQYLSLGCCTIAPPIKTLLPGPSELLPGEHYVCCKADYSDLVDKVRWCSDNRDECRRIGAAAKALWRATCRPVAIWERIREIMADLPYRLCLAGGWMDQPWMSSVCPGSCVVVNIEATQDFDSRSGLATSTRETARELWGDLDANCDLETTAKLLFGADNPPGTKEVSGSQDAIGLVYPGASRLYYDGGYWPDRIHNTSRAEDARWLEDTLRLVPLGPRPAGYNPLARRRITTDAVYELGQSGADCYLAIGNRDVKALGAAMNATQAAYKALLPNTVPPHIEEQLSQHKDGCVLCGAGGGGYAIVVGDEGIRFKVRTH